MTSRQLSLVTLVGLAMTEQTLQRVHTGVGVARRAAFHDRLRAERAEMEAHGGAIIPADHGVTMVRASEVLDQVPESLANYTLLKKRINPETQKPETKPQRRARQRAAAAAVQEQVQATRDGELQTNRTVEDGGSGGADRDAGGAGGAAVHTQQPRRTGVVQHSALADALEEDDDEVEAQRADEQPLLSAHGYDLSKALIDVRRRLREFLAEQAASDKSVPMQTTHLGSHPTIRWTIKFGKWLATTRRLPSKVSRWHFEMQADERAAETVVRTGRGEDSVYVMLQHMKNHVWREIWPGMPIDSRQYWRMVTHHVQSLFDGGGGGMKKAAELVGNVAGRAAAAAAAEAGGDEVQQQRASAAASKEAQTRTEAELRAATSKPCQKQHLHQTGEYQLQDTQLSEPFEANTAFVMNAYMCFARQTGCRPGMAVNDKADAMDETRFWCAACHCAEQACGFSVRVLRCDREVDLHIYRPTVCDAGVWQA
jgi:hypothetical protein